MDWFECKIQTQDMGWFKPNWFVSNFEKIQTERHTTFTQQFCQIVPKLNLNDNNIIKVLLVTTAVCSTRNKF